MNKQADLTKFNAVDAAHAAGLIRFLDARKEIEDENHIKRLIVDLLELRDGHQVLDLGSGTGDDARQVVTFDSTRPSAPGGSRDRVVSARTR